jgi:very-short-patch-repair endonuclease
MSHPLKPHSSRAALLDCRARQMRQHPTHSELVLWQAIRGQRLGVAFRRQVPLGSYIVDFLAPSARLIVEVDGGYNQARRKADARRDRWLHQQGYTVLRLPAAMVLENLAGALNVIRLGL